MNVGGLVHGCIEADFYELLLSIINQFDSIFEIYTIYALVQRSRLRNS